MFVRGPALCTSGTSWSLVWSSWSTTTQMTPRSVVTGTMLRSRGKKKDAPCERFMPRLSLGKAIVACKVDFNTYLSQISEKMWWRVSITLSSHFVYLKLCWVFGYQSGRWAEVNFLLWYLSRWQNMFSTGNILRSEERGSCV